MYQVNFEVRDNEIDIQGVVNNANYLIYMAHARHKFLQHMGIDFSQMARDKLNLMLISSFVEFKKPLLPNDHFYVTCKLVPEGKLRFVFEQEIRKQGTDELCAKGINTGVCIDATRNRPVVPDNIKALLGAV